MKKFSSPYLIALIITYTFISCNKSKKIATKFEGTTWTVTSITIDNLPDSIHPILTFKEGDIYREVLLGNWYNTKGSASYSTFAWQFSNKGKVFEISNQTEGVDALMCYTLSGRYDVFNFTKNTIEIRSRATQGYSNKLVSINMTKQ